MKMKLKLNWLNKKDKLANEIYGNSGQYYNLAEL